MNGWCNNVKHCVQLDNNSHTIRHRHVRRIFKGEAQPIMSPSTVRWFVWGNPRKTFEDVDSILCMLLIFSTYISKMIVEFVRVTTYFVSLIVKSCYLYVIRMEALAH